MQSNRLFHKVCLLSASSICSMERKVSFFLSLCLIYPSHVLYVSWCLLCRVCFGHSTTLYWYFSHEYVLSPDYLLVLFTLILLYSYWGAGYELHAPSHQYACLCDPEDVQSPLMVTTIILFYNPMHPWPSVFQLHSYC